MICEDRNKIFQSVVTTAGFALFISLAYRLCSGDNFGERAPDIIIFSSYLALSLSALFLFLTGFPFVKFSREVYSLTVSGEESSTIKNIFKLGNCCFAIYCSIQASSIIGAVFHVSWTSMPFSSVFLTFFIFAPFYIMLSAFLSLLNFHRRNNSTAVLEACNPSSEMRNFAPLILILLLNIMSHCWIITFNSFGRDLLESFAYNYDFQSHSCRNVTQRNVVYLSSSHARVLVRQDYNNKVEYVILSCVVGS